MMRLVLLLALVASPAAATVRTVLVGIDIYAHSAGKPGNSDPEFIDLGGAVSDIVLVRSVLAGPRWGLAMDKTAPGDRCPRVAPAMTLFNACATRAGIIAAITGQIMAAAPGDTLLFYYTGHGSQALDLTSSEESGQSGTIVPQDGRDGSVSDILDIELKRLIDAAEARGVNFVTIADSCHSGTLTRDISGGQSRDVNPDPLPPRHNADIDAAVAKIAALPAPRLAGARPYRVLLAAAADGQPSRERGTAPNRHGVFTVQFVAALTELSSPSYADLAEEVRRRLAAANEPQTPKFEGPDNALKTAFLDSSRASSRIFDAEADAGGQTITMTGGGLAGVTSGSSFAIHAGRGAPPAGAAPLALAIVDSVRPGDATLRPAGPFAGTGPLVAVEREHVYSTPPLALRIDGGTPTQAQRLAKAIASVPGLADITAAPSHVLRIADGRVHLLRVGDGHEIGTGWPADGTDVETRTLDAVKALSRFAALLSLRNDQGAKWGAINFRLICPAGDTAALEIANGVPVAYVGDRLSIGYINRAGVDLYAHLVALDNDTLEITPLYLGPDRLPAGTPLRYLTGALSGSGRQQVLLLLADQPVAIHALQQDGQKSLPNSLDRLLAAAMAGDAPVSRSILRVNAWGATLAEMIIAPGQRKGPSPCPPAF